MDRRSFITDASMAALALSLPKTETMEWHQQNKLPAWKGFNLLDFFSPDPGGSRGETIEDHFRWMRDWGFNFVRLPMAYPYYLDIDRTKNITPDDVYKVNNKAVDQIDELVNMVLKYNMHVSLN